MSSMSYCRFQNTLKDLADCYEALSQGVYDDVGLLSDRTDEEVAMSELIDLCGEIYHQYSHSPTCEEDPD